MNISIFAKRAFLNTNPYNEFESKEKSYKGHGHLQRVSSTIRADQIVEKIGAKLNPKSGYQDDVCIYVKPMVRKGDDFIFEGKKSYIDIVDGHNLGQVALRHPEVGVITCSKADFDIMKSSIPNKVVFIPQHHCNFERFKRERKQITTVGAIGTESSFAFLPENLKLELEKRGMELITFSKFFDRRDIIDFYNKIDIQIVWRPWKKRLSNPLKLINAASFGIPSIALDEEAFRKELAGYYLPVRTFEEFLEKVDSLKNNMWEYDQYSKKLIDFAENYHIDKVAELYKTL